MGKQLKISDLKRVVNIDKVSEYAKILSNEKMTNPKEIERILRELATKTPSKEVLMKTRLGFILKEISTREILPQKTRHMARDLRVKWKDFHKKLLLAPKFDVKCDKPTMEHRMKARDFIRNSMIRLSNTQTDILKYDPANEIHLQLVTDIEFKAYQFSDTLVNARYFGLVRRCMKVLASEPEMKTRLLESDLKANEFVLNCSVVTNTSNFFDTSINSSFTGEKAKCTDKLSPTKSSINT